MGLAGTPRKHEAQVEKLSTMSTAAFHLTCDSLGCELTFPGQGAVFRESHISTMIGVGAYLLGAAGNGVVVERWQLES